VGYVIARVAIAAATATIVKPMAKEVYMHSAASAMATKHTTADPCFTCLVARTIQMVRTGTFN
jgi:hypothetical protein